MLIHTKHAHAMPVHSRMDWMVIFIFCNFILIWVVHVLLLRAFIIYVNKWVCLTQSSTHTHTHTWTHIYVYALAYLQNRDALWSSYCVYVSSPFLNKPLVIVRNWNSFNISCAAKKKLSTLDKSFFDWKGFHAFAMNVRGYIFQLDHNNNTYFWYWSEKKVYYTLHFMQQLHMHAHCTLYIVHCMRIWCWWNPAMPYKTNSTIKQIWQWFIFANIFRSILTWTTKW